MNKKDKYTYYALSWSRLFLGLTPIFHIFSIIFLVVYYMIRDYPDEKELHPPEHLPLARIQVAIVGAGAGFFFSALLYIIQKTADTPYMMYWSNGGNSNRDPDEFRPATPTTRVDLHRQQQQFLAQQQEFMAQRMAFDEARRRFDEQTRGQWGHMGHMGRGGKPALSFLSHRGTRKWDPYINWDSYHRSS